MAKVIKDSNGCWIWTGSTRSLGRFHYGKIKINGKNPGTHRVTYEFAKGPIPDGLEIDHLCRNTLCCNPAHLETVTHAENRRRAFRAHCKRGHHKLGQRNCPTCERDRHHRRRQCRG